MAELALILYLGYLALAFGLRTVIQLHKTGTTGFHGIGGRPGTAEWMAGLGFAVALIVAGVAPVLALLNVIEPIATLDTDAVRAAGLVMTAAGIAATLYAQVAMGTSWRIGVAPDERTQLITSGPFALVRNPFFSAMLPTVLGLVLLVPSPVAVFGLIGLVIALELQVRVVEEPYLLRAQGHDYSDYASRVGRFIPGVGRL